MILSITIRDDLYRELMHLAGDDVNRVTEEAISDWLERSKAFARDPFFTLGPVPTGIRDAASSIDSTLYGEAP